MELPTLKNKYCIFILAIIGIMFISGCAQNENLGDLYRAGMLMEGTIKDQPWNEKGYAGLKAIGEEYGVEVEAIENVSTEAEVSKAVSKLVEDGANLIFGHSSTYGEYFYQLSQHYPEVHFVYFNGNYYRENLTSMTFNSHAMGFFAGMLASQMSSTKQVGIIAAYQWQPEIEGFYEGVKYQDSSTNVQMEFIYDWNDKAVAIEAYNRMKANGVDVFYPAGDVFSEEIITTASQDNLYALGFVSDQLEIEPETVLTSTVQHVDELYTLAAEEFNNGKLDGEILSFDFKDDFITLGEFSSKVPRYYQAEINKAIEEYKKTGLLPNQY